MPEPAQTPPVQSSDLSGTGVPQVSIPTSVGSGADEARHTDSSTASNGLTPPASAAAASAGVIDLSASEIEEVTKDLEKQVEAANPDSTDQVVDVHNDIPSPSTGASLAQSPQAGAPDSQPNPSATPPGQPTSPPTPSSSPPTPDSSTGSPASASPRKLNITEAVEITAPPTASFDQAAETHPVSALPGMSQSTSTKGAPSAQSPDVSEQSGVEASTPTGAPLTSASADASPAESSVTSSASSDAARAEASTDQFTDTATSTSTAEITQGAPASPQETVTPDTAVTDETDEETDEPDEVPADLTKAAPSGQPAPATATASNPPAASPASPTAPQPAVPATATKPTSLLEALVQLGALTADQVAQLEQEKISSAKSVEQLITEKNLVSEEQLTQAQAALYSIPFIKIYETGISPEALNALPESVAKRYQMLPFAVNTQEKTLSVAMQNPLDVTAIDFAQQKTGLRIIEHYATPSELQQKIAERYAQTLSGEVSRALEESGQGPQKQQQAEVDLSQATDGVVRQAPITKIVETVLSFAMKSRASDVHIEPLLDRTRVRYRIDGILREKLILPQKVHDSVVSRIKILSRMKIDEKRVPQDGRFTFESGGVEVDLRVSTLPTIHGEKVVMRLLKKNLDVPTLNELGLDGIALRRVQDAIKVPHGVILITGPTGSGKTTTLYSILNQISSPKINIMTLEDPVEYQMTGVNQVQVNPQAGLTFASGLRSFLRQDPNVIMVGEIRDTETVELAIQASLTGHLVFSTLHTSSAAGALPRLVDMGAETFLLASSMQLVMAQRVVRKLNPDYVEEYQPEPAVIEDIRSVLGEQFDTWCKNNNTTPEQLKLKRSQKNIPKGEPEYKGRIGIFEVMPIDEEMTQMIIKGESADNIEKNAQKKGMLLMKQDGYFKALAGITTIEEVLRVAEV